MRAPYGSRTGGLATYCGDDNFVTFPSYAPNAWYDAISDYIIFGDTHNRSLGSRLCDNRQAFPLDVVTAEDSWRVALTENDFGIVVLCNPTLIRGPSTDSSASVATV